MERRLALHPAQRDVRIHVTIRLGARLVHGHEAVHLNPMARHAHDVPERGRVGLEMGPVSCRGGHALPCLPPVRNVAVLADLVWHRCMGWDFLGSFKHPVVELPRADKDRLLVAVVAAQRVVLARRKPLEGRSHDVATGAEPVVVLHVVPAHRSGACGRHQRHHCGGNQGKRHSPRTSKQPRRDVYPPPPHKRRQGNTGDQRADGADDLDRLGNVKQKTDERRGPTWQRRLHHDGVLGVDSTEDGADLGTVRHDHALCLMGVPSESAMVDSAVAPCEVDRSWPTLSDGGATSLAAPRGTSNKERRQLLAYAEMIVKKSSLEYRRCRIARSRPFPRTDDTPDCRKVPSSARSWGATVQSVLRRCLEE